MGALSCSQTYFSLSVSLSIHFAIHIELWSRTTSFQGPGGVAADSPRLRTTSVDWTRGFQRPLIGCCPLPMKRPGGSTIQFAMSTSLPSRIAFPYFALRASLLCFLDAACDFFPSLVIPSLAAFSLSTFAKNSEKSMSWKLTPLHQSGSTFTKSETKFEAKTGSAMYGVSFFFARL